VDDAVSFFQAFAGMQQGFAERAGAVQQLLTDPTTAFVLVTTPAPDSLEEATWFTQHLRARGIVPAAAVVNRCHPRFGADPDAAWPDDGVVGAQLSVLASLERAARHDEEVADAIAAVFGDAAVSAVPLTPRPARDVTGLEAVAGCLATAPSATRGPVTPSPGEPDRGVR